MPGRPPNTSLALLLLGTAGALRHREDVGRVPWTLALLAALVVVAGGVGTLADYALDVPLHGHGLLGGRDGGSLPGRSAALSALALTLLGAALLVFDVGAPARVRPAEWLVLLAALTAFTGLTGYVFGAGPLHRLPRVPVVGMAPSTAIGLLLTSMGLLLERPTTGVMRLATSPGAAGVLLRRLVLPAMLAPVLLGVLVTRVSAAVGLEELAVVAAILASTMAAVGLALLLVTAAPLDRAHEALASSRRRVRELVQQAPDGIFVADLDGRYTDVNEAGCRLLGYAREEIVGRTIVELLPPGDVERLARSREQLLRGAVEIGEWRLRRRDGSYVPVEVSARILPDGRWQGFVRDIGERKRLEEQAEAARAQLRESEERFRLAFEEAPIGMALVALDGRFVRVNRALCDIVGYGAAELTGLTFQAITHPQDLGTDLSLADRLRRGEIPRYQLAKRYIRRDGAIVDVMLSGSVLRGRGGEPLYFIAQIEDVTERQRLEAEVRQSRERFELALKGADLAAWDWDVQSGRVLFNARWAEVRGFRPEDIAPRVESWTSGVHPDDWPRVQRALADHFDGRASEYATEYRVRTQSGTWIWVLDRGKVFARDASGRPTRMVGIELDITERKRLEEERRRIEHEQRFLAEAGAVLAGSLDLDETVGRFAALVVREIADVCIVDVIGDDGALRRVKVAGRDPARQWACDALMGIRLDRDRPHLVRSVLETKEHVLIPHVTPDVVASWAQDAQHLRALRGIDPRSLIAVPLLAHGKLVGVLGLVSSSAARAYGPDDLRLADELARRAALSLENARLYAAAGRAIRARDDVMGVVAHDLRNPLGTIGMQAELLRRRGTELDGPTRTSVDMIQRAAARMNRLIQDLLDVAAMEGGRLSMEREHLPPARVLSDAVEGQTPFAASAGLEIGFAVGEGLPDVWADRDRLLQVLENLVGNAVKFTEPGGRITVGAAPRETDVFFWVADTGSGIAAEDLPHVFDRFWQAGTPRRRGAGLGLAIVKGIVEAHGGRVWAESSPGRGSTFFFTIPTARRDDVSQPPAARLAR